jgi:alkaline phosphatase D
MSAAHPIISTVDDHEFADGAWRDGATEHEPARDGPWSHRKAAAFQAREEWLPVRRPDMARPDRVYRSIPIGGLAELFLLDTRTMRDEPVPAPAMLHEGRTNLGPDQKAWLYDALGASTARWLLLGNPSVMARTWNDRLPDFVRQALVKVKLIDTDGTGPDYDQWDGYPVERREVLDKIGKLRESNVVVLSGDVHVALAAELAETPSDPPVAVEFVNTSLTSQNLDDKMGWGLRTKSLEVEKALLAGMPHLQYVDLDSHGFSIVDVDVDRVRFEWWTVEALETRAPGASMSGAMWVRHGTPRLIADGATEPRPAPAPPKPPRRTKTRAAATKPSVARAARTRKPAAP